MVNDLLDETICHFLIKPPGREFSKGMIHQSWEGANYIFGCLLSTFPSDKEVLMFQVPGIEVTFQSVEYGIWGKSVAILISSNVPVFLEIIGFASHGVQWGNQGIG